MLKPVVKLRGLNLFHLDCSKIVQRFRRLEPNSLRHHDELHEPLNQQSDIFLVPHRVQLQLQYRDLQQLFRALNQK